jgi:protein-L-isoaspartate(D-aspartate) O-methyltransferase
VRETQDELLRLIGREMQETAQWTGRSALSERVARALAQVPREAFVPPGDARYAYANVPLPIGFGQTISQPYVVALMTELLDCEPEHVVLEIGTGSGYETAILARLVREVYTVERVAELATSARERLARLGFEHVHVLHADGYEGWADHAPYDGIMVTAAAPRMPPRLVEQLAPSGRMVIPLGEPGISQELVVATKDERGELTERAVLPVAFVPMVPGAGQE